MQFGNDKKLQPSDISDYEKRGMISFAGRGGPSTGEFAMAPYVLDKSGSVGAPGGKTRNQGTLYGERTSDGGDQPGVDPRQMMPMLDYQDQRSKDLTSSPYTFQNQIVQQYQQANAGGAMYLGQGPRQRDPPDIRDAAAGAIAANESPNIMGMPNNGMDGVYHDMKK